MLGFLTVALLPNRPERTKLLTEREREIALHRMNKVARGDVGYTVNRGAAAPMLQVANNSERLSSAHLDGFQGLEGIHRRCHLLRIELRVGEHIGVSAYYHQDLWIQCVCPLPSDRYRLKILS